MSIRFGQLSKRICSAQARQKRSCLAAICARFAKADSKQAANGHLEQFRGFPHIGNSQPLVDFDVWLGYKVLALLGGLS